MSLALNHSLQEAEVTFLESLRSEYESKGYRFIVHPSRPDLPDFFATYEPDAVAQKSDHNVAIEVKSRATPTVQQSLQRIRRLFEGRSDWQLRVAYVGSDPYGARHLPVSSRAEVLDRAKEVEQLVKNGNVRAAFVVAWSLLEAALNNARPEADKRPRTPGTVVQTLAMDGLIPDELEQSLRSLIELRNRVVHGDLTVEPSTADVQIVLSAVKAVLG
jgi:uncharacterized protein YutE (UPF0331/DUF86 family)